MSTKSGAVDQWRKYFQGANANIFEVIEQAITIAAMDSPKEFKVRRDQIAEKLFTCGLIQCLGCDLVGLPVAEDEEDGGFKSNLDKSSDGGLEGAEGKESKGNSSTNDKTEFIGNQMSHYSYNEAEALTEEIEEENQIIGEVLRIKEILFNYEEESHGVLFDSLRRLQLMALSMNILQVTEIGKAVGGLSKHGSKEIRRLARTLIDVWKVTVDEWVSVNGPIAGTDGSPDSVNPSVVDVEEGLPSPPLDEGAFFTQPTSMELSQFFDGIDEDGNLCNSGEFDKNHERGRKPTPESQSTTKRKPQTPHEANIPNRENKSRQMMKLEPLIKPAILFNTDSEHKANNETKLHQKVDILRGQNRPLSNQQDSSRYSDDVSVRMKLEASKRKLQEGYRQAENDKKQRTIQVMELHDLPKQVSSHKSTHMKTGNHNRHWILNKRR